MKRLPRFRLPGPRDRPCWTWGLLVLAALGLLGCGEDEPLRLTSPLSRLEIVARPDGQIDFGERGGPMILRGGAAEALIEEAGEQRTISTEGCAGSWELEDEPPTAAAYFAEARGLRWRCSDHGVVLSWRVFLDSRHDTALALLGAENASPGDVRVLRVTPLVASGPSSGLFLGDDPARLRILDNGSNVAADVDVKLHYPDEKRNTLVGALLPIESRGSVVSNWNHAVVDLDSGRSWIAGALGVERSFPTLGTRWVAGEAPRDGGREGLELWVDNALEFAGKLLSPGESVSSEPMVFSPLATDPQSGLEEYADAVAGWLGFTVWTKRGEGRRVPNGWNSWTGSGSTGGLGTNIDETIATENLEVMAREFMPFGVDYFQVDDGYQVADGDCFPRKDRFPSGMPAWAERVEKKGLIPGLWISAFTIDESSQLASEHPEYLADPEDNVVKGLLSPGAGKRVLDLSSDAALDWVGETMRRYREDWRMRWVKLDFAYLAFPYVHPQSPKLTSIETYKRAIRKPREVLGDDAFYLGIALMGVNYGVVDGMRVTMDTGPRWEENDPFALLGDGGNFKSTVKSASRRYWLHGRVWINHADLLFFRTDSDPKKPAPPVTLEEATTLSSFIGLTGSIVKFGEDLRKLGPEQIQIWRKLLPIYPRSARPLDLFTRMYPEEWLLPIEGTLAGSDARWWVVGLLGWGRNYDYSEDGAPRKMPDEARSHSLDLASLGLAPDRDYLASEFWSEKFLGVVRGSLDAAVGAHGHALIALRESTGHPQLLGHNRHFTQGGTDLAEESWDEQTATLRLAFDLDRGGAGAVPFEYKIRIYVPHGWTLSKSDLAGGEPSQTGEVITVKLLPKKPGRATLSLSFARAE